MGICLLLPLAAFLITASCEKQPMRIGFIGPMTGPSANIGSEGYKGFMMAIENANLAGGFRGSPIEVVLEDDGGDPARCAEASARLAESGIAILALHTTSGAAAGALPDLLKRDILVASHTVSDPSWVGRDDNFFRLVGTSKSFGRSLGAFAATKGRLSVAEVVDLRNEAYALSFIEGFRSGKGPTEVRGRKTVGEGFSHAETAAWAASLSPDAVLAVLSGLDAAKLAQALDRTGYRGDLLLAPWAQDHNLLSYSGRMADRIFLPNSFDPQDPSPRFQEFKKRHEELYADSPTMSGVFGYEIGSFLVEGLRKAGKADPASLKRALLSIPEFEGLQQTIRIDRTGDADMDFITVGIQNGAFFKVER